MKIQCALCPKDTVKLIDFSLGFTPETDFGQKGDMTNSHVLLFQSGHSH